MTEKIVAWKVFKASGKRFEKNVRRQLELEGYEEWHGSVDHDTVPHEIWEQYVLENIHGNSEIRLLGFVRKGASDGATSKTPR